MDKVNISEKMALFSEHWSPKIVGELNGQQVKLVKFAGEFLWHHHENEDELFLVVKGFFRMELRDRSIELHEGEFLIVPRGVEHRPVAEEKFASCSLNLRPPSTRVTSLMNARFPISPLSDLPVSAEPPLNFMEMGLETGISIGDQGVPLRRPRR